VTTSARRILLVGVGAMGAPMAANLAAARHVVTVCDGQPGRAVGVAAEIGGSAVDSEELPAAAAQAEVLVLMLPDSSAVEEVLEQRGLLTALRPGAAVLDMGSSDPTSSVRLARRAAASGLVWADAPVSGGVTRARTGELAVMVGGSPEAVEMLMPVLSAVGGDIVHVGPAGAGHAMKALNNLLSAVGLAAAAEVLTIGANFGLDPATMLGVLNSSTGRNHATEVKVDRFVFSGAFDSGFALRLMVKDLTIALDLAHTTRTPVPLAAACLQEWTAAGHDLGPAADHTEIAAYVAGRGHVRLSRSDPNEPDPPRRSS
jgi:3-hydroxyisobutyrate dehydrogenase